MEICSRVYIEIWLSASKPSFTPIEENLKLTTSDFDESSTINGEDKFLDYVAQSKLGG